MRNFLMMLSTLCMIGLMSGAVSVHAQSDNFAVFEWEPAAISIAYPDGWLDSGWDETAAYIAEFNYVQGSGPPQAGALLLITMPDPAELDIPDTLSSISMRRVAMEIIDTTLEIDALATTATVLERDDGGYIFVTAYNDDYRSRVAVVAAEGRLFLLRLYNPDNDINEDTFRKMLDSIQLGEQAGVVQIGTVTEAPRANPVPLQNGVPQEGRFFTTSTTPHYYVLDAAPGQFLNVDVIADNHRDLWTDLALLVDDTAYVWRDTPIDGAYNAKLYNIELPAGASFVLEVSREEGAGYYDIIAQLTDVPVEPFIYAPFFAGTITYGDSIENFTTYDLFFDVYRFEGQAGDVMTVTAFGRDAVDDEEADPVIWLYDIFGQTLATSLDYDFDAPTARIPNFTLPADGVYYLTVGGGWPGFFGTADYTLTLEVMG